MLSEDDYASRAHSELVALLDSLDALETDQLEVELESDILTLEFADGTKYVVNSHRAARQIWMAAERTAWHFDWDEAQKTWLAKKSGDELWAAVSRVTGNKLGKPLTLARPPA